MRFILALLISAAATPSPGSGEQILVVDTLPVQLHAEGQTEPTEHGRPVGAIQLNETVVVGDAHSGSLHYWSSDSRQWTVAGRFGEGPGEFRHVYWIGTCGGGEVYAWDLMRRLIIVYDTNGDFRREYPLPRDRREVPFTVACSRQGAFAFQPLSRSAQQQVPGTTIVRGQAPVFLTSASGEILAELPAMPTDEMVVLQGGGSPRPLGKRTSIAVASDRVYIGSADSAWVDVYDLEGNRLKGVLLAGIPAPRAPTPANIEMGIEEIVNHVGGGMAQRVRTLLEAVPPVERQPWYSALLVDPLDFLWVVTSHPGDLGTQLHVYDTSGRPVELVRLPKSMKVHEIGIDYILGHFDDGVGGPQVGLYKMYRR